MTPPRLAEPYQRHPVREAYDAIVIGSGIGGLAAAALLARHGRRRVLVLERHYAIGGFTHVFRRPGYEWDVGVHYVGEVQPGGLLRPLFDEITDVQLAWADMGPVYDRVFLGETRFDFPRGEDALRARLVERFPTELNAIDRYFALVHETVAATHDFLASKAFPRLIGAMVMPFARGRFFRLSDRTTREVLESLTADQRLIGVLTAQWGDYGLPPAQSSFAAHALIAHHYLGGGSYPVGGAARIAQTIAPVIRTCGGELLSNAEVAEIVIEGNRAAGVRMAADGAVLRAPLVISDAGVANTFGRLVPAPLAERHGLRAALAGLSPSIAHACLYVGLRGTARELGLERSNIWVYPDERHEHTLAVAADAAAPPPAYISFPSAKDPDFERRCPSRATIEVATLLPWARFDAWRDTRWHKRGTDYAAVKQALATRLLDILYRHVPQTRGAVEIAELSTPLSTRHFAGHPQGEIYGVAHSPARFRHPLLRPQTPVRGLFLTGADVATCGVGGALIGGALCASAILRRNLIDAARRTHGERAAA
jgi:all-trans-retinol 13,14-reductase